MKYLLSMDSIVVICFALVERIETNISCEIVLKTQGPLLCLLINELTSNHSSNTEHNLFVLVVYTLCVSVIVVLKFNFQLVWACNH